MSMEYTILTPTGATKLIELRIVNTTGHDRSTLEVLLTLQGEEPSTVVELVFGQVQGLSVKDLNAHSIVGPIKVMDLRSQQLEGISFKVMDFEEERLVLLCNKITQKQT